MSSVPQLSARRRLADRGPRALADEELVAILLRTGDVGVPVSKLAKTLLDESGGLADLLSIQEGASGCGDQHRSSRPELAVILEVARRAIGQQLQSREVFASPDAVKNYLQLHLARKPREEFAVMFLDAQNRLIELSVMFRGTLTQTSVYPREVVLEALQRGAAAVILAHNHPSGTVQPSRADEALTQTIKAALALVDVRVLDHIIVAPGQALSMAEKGML